MNIDSTFHERPSMKIIIFNGRIMEGRGMKASIVPSFREEQPAEPEENNFNDIMMDSWTRNEGLKKRGR